MCPQTYNVPGLCRPTVVGFTHWSAGTLFFLRVATFPKERFIPGLDASPELSIESHKDREKKKTVVFLAKPLYLHPDGTGVESLGIKDNHQHSSLYFLWEMVTSKSPLKNPVWGLCVSGAGSPLRLWPLQAWLGIFLWAEKICACLRKLFHTPRIRSQQCLWLCCYFCKDGWDGLRMNSAIKGQMLEYVSWTTQSVCLQTAMECPGFSWGLAPSTYKAFSVYTICSSIPSLIKKTCSHSMQFLLCVYFLSGQQPG